MTPEIIVIIISLVANAIGWLFTRFYYRLRYRAELDETRARAESLEAASTLSTVQAADVVARSTTAILQPLLDRITEMQKELILVKKEKEELAARAATSESKYVALLEENAILRSGFER